jgi:hypothetical protein
MSGDVWLMLDVDVAGGVADVFALDMVDIDSPQWREKRMMMMIMPMKGIVASLKRCGQEQ